MVVGFLKVGYKKLFLLVSHLISHASLILSLFDLLVSDVQVCLMYFLPLGLTGRAHRGGATVRSGFLHRGELAATWLWNGAV